MKQIEHTNISTTYRFGPFSLNGHRSELLEDGRVVQLTPKAFDILLLLVQNSDRIVSVAEIMERVWQGAMVDYNNVPQQISRIRRALGGEQYVTSIPSRGYRFTADVVSESEVTQAGLDESMMGAPTITGTEVLGLARSKSALDALVHLMGLDVFGPPLASAARMEMRYASLLLVLTGSFEILALACAVYIAVFDDLFRPFSVAFSLVVGVLIGGLVLLLQRQIIVADFADRSWRVLLFLVFPRVVLIFLMTVWTSAPLGIVLFRVPINAYLHKEWVNAEIVKAYTRSRTEMVRPVGNEVNGSERARSLRAYLLRVSTMRPGDVVEDRELGLSFRAPAPSFLDSIRALHDIENEVPPQWSPRAHAAAQWLSNMEVSDDEFGSLYPAEGSAIRSMSLAMLALNSMIPLLCVAFKLLMSESLAAYYSVTFQSHAGHGGNGLLESNAQVT